jgi:hypothetical protein
MFCIATLRTISILRNVGRVSARFRFQRQSAWDYSASKKNVGQRVNTAFEIQAQTPKGEPCLSVIDYMNWAVYRAFTRGDMGYFQTIEDKVSLLVDLYDTQKYPKNWYNRRDKFDLKKITPL